MESKKLDRRYPTGTIFAYAATLASESAPRSSDGVSALNRERLCHKAANIRYSSKENCRRDDSKFEFERSILYAGLLTWFPNANTPGPGKFSI